MKNKTYIDYIQEIANEDCEILRKKDIEYGGSWLKRGGCGATMMALRKVDRFEIQAQRFNWDVFAASAADNREEGILDDLADLTRYLLLIRSEILVRRLNAKPETKPEPKPAEQRSESSKATQTMHRKYMGPLVGGGYKGLTLKNDDV